MVNPIGMMDEMPHWLMNAWAAYYSIEPWDVGSVEEDEQERKMVRPEEALQRLRMRMGSEWYQ